MRSLAVRLVRLYQRLAPPRIRERCRFHPSCSEYAVLSLEKDGVVAGLPRIVHRLRRCRPPNGGDDWP